MISRMGKSKVKNVRIDPYNLPGNELLSIALALFVAAKKPFVPAVPAVPNVPTVQDMKSGAITKRIWKG
jgi:hypothetical protein